MPSARLEMGAAHRETSLSVFDFGARLLRQLPAESAHQATLVLAGCIGPLLPAPKPDDARLGVKAFGLNFPNAIGLAAGFDKNADVPDAMAKFGFGFVECGTVTPRPQTGNPRPRLFRLTEDRAVINRMGFNNGGMEAAARNLKARPSFLRGKARGIVGINIGANKDSEDRIADYAVCFAQLAPLADYVTVNVSSPNTPGLRALQAKAPLIELVDAVKAARDRLGLADPPPILVKVAPDLSAEERQAVAEVALEHGLDGLIVSNTTIARPADLRSQHRGETGGLSGRPLRSLALAALADFHRLTQGRLPLIGVGGIESGADAYARIRAGASLVQVYTALIYGGPGLIVRILDELETLLAQDGFASLSEAVGAGLPSSS